MTAVPRNATDGKGANAEDTRDAALERAFLAVLLTPHAEQLTAEEWSALLERVGVAEQDAIALKEQGVGQFLLYRRLIFKTLRGAIEAVTPATAHCLGEALDASLIDYVTHHGPQSRALRTVTSEFVRHCAPQWRTNPQLPPYLLELADFELAQVAVSAAPDSAGAPREVPLTLESKLRFITACQVRQYAHRVHDAVEAFDAGAHLAAPLATPTHLLLYRDATNSRRLIELSPLACSILSRLLGGAALAVAVQEACIEACEPITPAVLDGTAALLADLSERGVLVGVENSALDPDPRR